MVSPAHSIAQAQRESLSPPPIPPHTTAMLQPPEAEKKPKKQNYINTIINKIKGGDKTQPEPEDQTSNINNRRKTQVDMKRRPLPAEPLVNPVHADDEYERPDTFLERPPMPLPPSDFHPASFNPWMLHTPHNPYPYMSPTPNTRGGPMLPYRDDVDPRWLNPNWIGNQQRPSEPLVLQEQLQRMQLAQQHIPRRSHSFQVGKRNIHWDTDTDDEGYQKTEMIDGNPIGHRLPPDWSMGHRQIPAHHPPGKSFSFEYDYPELRSFRSLPPPKRSGRNMPHLPTRGQHRPLTKEESYVNMDAGAGDDDYQNSDIIASMTDFVKPLRLPPRSKGGSMDDSALYYNTRSRSILLSPPLTPNRSLLPPRGGEGGTREEEGSMDDGGLLMQPLESEQPQRLVDDRPSLPPKPDSSISLQRRSMDSTPPTDPFPPVMPDKARSNKTMPHSSSVSSIESDSSVPPPIPGRPLPAPVSKPIVPPPLPSKGPPPVEIDEETGQNKETGQSKKIFLPPRNIPRPGYKPPVQEYTTIIN